MAFTISPATAAQAAATSPGRFAVAEAGPESEPTGLQASVVLLARWSSEPSPPMESPSMVPHSELGVGRRELTGEQDSSKRKVLRA